MPTLLYKGYGLVKGVAFDSWRQVGAAMQAIKVYNMREVDEMVFQDITATLEKRQPDYELIDELADECFMPLTVGGGVCSCDEMRRLLSVGADKVSINTGAVERPGLVRECAETFGSQCVVVSIDARREADDSHRVYIRSGTQPTGRDPADMAAEMESLGAGEILLTSIDRDGTMSGYDIELVRRVAAAVNVPVIASGGAGGYADMESALQEGGASAVAAASIYHFTELTPAGAKLYLRERGFSTRI
jgi:cyclase